jgi:hypothetical protein
MPLADAWSVFIKYARGDGSDPAMVGISCSPKAWPTIDGEIETVKCANRLGEMSAGRDPVGPQPSTT